MDKSTTKHLEEMMIDLGSQDDLTGYIESPDTLLPFDSFAEYYGSLDKVTAIDQAEIVRRSGIERTYCYQILNGTRPHPGRDKIIRLCLAADLSVKETVRALEASSEAILYSRRKRDVVIAYAVNHGLSVEDTNILLDQFEEKPLA